MTDGNRDPIVTFIRMAGFCSIAGGVLFLIGVAAHPLRDGFTIRSWGHAYGAEHSVILLGLILQLIGIAGFQIRQVRLGVPIGSVAFLIALLGQVLWIMVITIDATWNPLLAEYRPQDVHVKMDDPLIMIITVAGMVTFAVGYLLLGRFIMRMRDSSSIFGVLIALGGPLYIVGGLCIFILGPKSIWVTVIETAGAIPFGIGFVWLGRLISRDS